MATQIAQISSPDGVSSRILFTSPQESLPQEAGLFVFDGNTAPLFPRRELERSLNLPPGEKAKNWASVERILNRALALSLDRDEFIAGIGGGVLTDVTAFAASMYKRGCRLALVPTTLLGMVDAAIGGKTGIDFGGAKNLVGSYYLAEEVRICPPLLESLPEREFHSGLAEVIKHAFLAPESLLDLMRNKSSEILARDKDVLEELISQAVRVKIDVVSQDLKERGRREILNLGHTFGHALEAVTSFSRWSHGEAVGWGMFRALDLGERLGITDPAWAAEARALLKTYQFHLVDPQAPAGEIKSAMRDDKKIRTGSLRFVISRSPGDTVVTTVPEKELDAVLGLTT